MIIGCWCINKWNVKPNKCKKSNRVFAINSCSIELIEDCKKKRNMKTVRKYLVSNKHLQLQLLFAQFLLSVVIADNNDSNALEAAENSTQSALRNQIAGKLKQHFPFKTAQSRWFGFKCTADIALRKFPFKHEFISSKLIAMLRFEARQGSSDYAACNFLTRCTAAAVVDADQDQSCWFAFKAVWSRSCVIYWTSQAHGN